MSRKVQPEDLISYLNESPLAVVVSCLDLREPLNMMLNTAIGDLVSIRSAAHILDAQTLLNLEISCREQGAKLVLFYGNSNNDIIKTALTNHLIHKTKGLFSLIEEAIQNEEIQAMLNNNESLDIITDVVAAFNIEKAKKDLITNSTYFNEKLKEGTIGVASAFFNRSTNSVTFSQLYKN